MSGFRIYNSESKTRTSLREANTDLSTFREKLAFFLGVSTGDVSNETLTRRWRRKGSYIFGEGVDDNSGWSVSVSGDGNVVAIGAINNDGTGSNAGNVRVYEYKNTEWAQRGVNINGEAIDDQSGWSISLNSDGSILAIGAPYNDNVGGNNAGHVKIYEWKESAWVQKGSTIYGAAINDNSGYSVSLSSDGGAVAIGAPYNTGNKGHVRVYMWNVSDWVQRGVNIDGDNAGDYSGWSVSLNIDGSVVAIGAINNSVTASNAGQVRIHKWGGSAWGQIGSDIYGDAADDNLGYSVSLSSDGSVVAIGAPYNDNNGSNSGHTRIYEWDGVSAWAQRGADIEGDAATDNSGWSVNLSSDGNVVAIGAAGNDENGSNSGNTRVYEWDDVSAWVQIGSDINGDLGDELGNSVSISSDGTVLVVGAYASGVSAQGSARVYKFI